MCQSLFLALHTLTQVTLAALLGRYLWCYPHYTDRWNQGTQQLSDLPKFTQIVTRLEIEPRQAPELKHLATGEEKTALFLLVPMPKRAVDFLGLILKIVFTHKHGWLWLSLVLFFILALPKEMPGIEEHLPFNFLPLRSELRLVQNHFWWCHSW